LKHLTWHLPIGVSRNQFKSMKEFLSDETLATSVLQELPLASQSASFKVVGCPLH
jgi:hypothetical protein